MRICSMINGLSSDSKKISLLWKLFKLDGRPTFPYSFQSSVIFLDMDVKYGKLQYWNTVQWR